MYYGTMSWANNFKRLNKVHYAAGKLIVGDWRRTQNEELIDETTRRLPPGLWLKYNIASFIIKCTRDKLYPDMAQYQQEPIP